MNKKLFLVITVVFLLSACNKQTGNFTGEYTYQTTGKLNISTDTASTVVDLDQEIGQLQIFKTDKAKTVKIVMTPLRGEITCFLATVNGKEIEFEQRNLSIDISDGLFIGKAEVQATSKGEIYDKNTIVINHTYQGSYIPSNILSQGGSVSSGNVVTLINRNK